MAFLFPAEFQGASIVTLAAPLRLGWGLPIQPTLAVNRPGQMQSKRWSFRVAPIRLYTINGKGQRMAKDFPNLFYRNMYFFHFYYFGLIVFLPLYSLLSLLLRKNGINTMFLRQRSGQRSGQKTCYEIMNLCPLH